MSLLPTLLHGMCIMVIISLTAFIVLEKTTDQNESLQAEWQFALRVGATEIEKSNHNLFKSIRKSIKQDSSDRSMEYWRKTQMVVSESEAMRLLLDSLQQKTNVNLLYEVQGKLSNYRTILWKVANFEPYIGETMNYLAPNDWLFQSWKNQSPDQFITTLEQTKAEIRLAETNVLNYFLMNCIPYYFCNFGWDQPLLWFDQLAPATGDLVTANITLGQYSSSIDKVVLRLNDEVLPMADGRAKFKVQYKQPGIYPLRFSIEKREPETDTLQVWEKTYYLRVRP